MRLSGIVIQRHPKLYLISLGLGGTGAALEYFLLNEILFKESGLILAATLFVLAALMYTRIWNYNEI